MRFVQFADVHLDSRISRSLGLTDEQREQVRQDVRAAFSGACDLARERRADLVLIPGDLFDHETADTQTLQFIADRLAGIAPVPVFIAPGNHDNLRAGSLYHEAWPENVHVFKAAEFESVALGDLDCSVTGIAHAHRGVTDRALAQPIPEPDRLINILLFHGSREGWKPTDKETVIPFTDTELLAQSFDYAAIGHYHSFGEIMDERGVVRAAYSGCAQGRGLDETGAKCVLFGEIDPGGGARLEQVEVAARRIVAVEPDVTGSSNLDGVADRIEQSIASSAVRECDVAWVRLRGVLAPGIDLDVSRLRIVTGCFHLHVDCSGVEPDYDLSAIAAESAAESIRASFVRRMLELENTASEEDRRTVRDAIYYGLCALDGRKLEPRDAD